MSAEVWIIGYLVGYVLSYISIHYTVHTDRKRTGNFGGKWTKGDRAVTLLLSLLVPFTLIGGIIGVAYTFLSGVDWDKEASW